MYDAIFSRPTLHADDPFVQLVNCPYDGTPIEVERVSGGSLLVHCPACEAAWERHGAWIGQRRRPDRAKVIAARADRTSVDDVVA